MLKHLSKEAEQTLGSPPAKRSCPDLQVNTESLQPAVLSLSHRIMQSHHGASRNLI